MGMSAVASIMPQSHELRYYMYWMITLVSLNLYLVSNLDELSKKMKPKWLNYQLFGIICLLILMIVIVATRGITIRPKFYSLTGLIQNNVEANIMEQIKPNDQICIVKKQPYTFLYSSFFHPELNYSYSTKAALSLTECGGMKPLD